MADPIEFYFEYSSPYGYFASKGIEALAAKRGREIVWHPFLLGAAFKREGTQSLISYPLKGAYSKHDIERTARYLGIPYTWPAGFPIFTVHAARATIWAQENMPDKAIPLIHALYDRIFGQGEDIGKPEAVLLAASDAGLDPDAVSAGMKSPEVKEMLRTRTEAALDRGVFGSPFFFVGKEPFWGSDRMEMLDAWLEKGGW